MFASLACGAVSIFFRFGAIVLWLLGGLSLLGVVLSVEGYGLADLPTIAWAFVLGAFFWWAAKEAWQTARQMW
jgi:hypothetical protein